MSTGLKYVNGGYRASCSAGYTERNAMSAPRDMKFLVTNLKMSGSWLFAKFCTAISIDPLSIDPSTARESKVLL